MSIPPPPLPYARTALEPHLSAATLDSHGQHHRALVERLNRRIEGTPLAGLPLEDVVRQARGDIFELAAEAWNHDFYWQCLAPRAGGEPRGRLAELIDRQFGGFARFKEAFAERALGLLGSGWVWLVQRGEGHLGLVSAANAATPLTGPDTPLLACDLWEHAYYLDHRNGRAGYLDAFWNLANWDFAASKLRP